MSDHEGCYSEDDLREQGELDGMALDEMRYERDEALAMVERLSVKVNEDRVTHWLGCSCETCEVCDDARALLARYKATP